MLFGILIEFTLRLEIDVCGVKMFTILSFHLYVPYLVPFIKILPPCYIYSYIFNAFDAILIVIVLPVLLFHRSL